MGLWDFILEHWEQILIALVVAVVGAFVTWVLQRPLVAFSLILGTLGVVALIWMIRRSD